MSVWKHLPKSSGLGKLSKKSRKAVSHYEKKRAANVRKSKSEEAKFKKFAKKTEWNADTKYKKYQKPIKPKPKPATWHFWGSRQTLEGKDKVVASLKRQGYKVRVDGAGDGYRIYTMGRASYYS